MFNMFIADVADYNEWKGFKRMEGSIGSLTGLAGKVGNALGGFVMGILMSLSGYVSGATRWISRCPRFMLTCRPARKLQLLNSKKTERGREQFCAPIF